VIRSPGKVIICFLKRDRLHKGRLREENEVGEGKQVGKQSNGRTRRFRRYMVGKVCAPGAPFDKEVFAILAAEFLPGDGFRLAQNGSDTLTGKRRTLGKSLGVTAVTVRSA
jgi:hypothetical protein